MQRQRIEQLTALYRDGLLDNTLRFWVPRSVDRTHGGFYTCFDRDGTLVDSDKGIWQQGRAAWLFGELYNTVEQRPEWLELAQHGVDFLQRHGADPADGRMWFLVTESGEPLRKRRYAYSESFAAIAYGELAQATGDPRYATRAEELFRAFCQQSLQPIDLQPKFTDVRPTRGLGFPMIAMATAQQLRDSIQLADADAWIDRSIEQIRRDHVKPELECVLETVSSDGAVIDHFDGRTLNPGHAIEAAWFILAEAGRRGDASLVELGCQMLDWMWQRGWDAEHGGVLYFVDLDGKPVQEYWHDMKFWWPHNETIIATLMAYQLTGDAKYADWHEQVHDWAYAHFPDPEHGEWYGYLHRDGRRSSTLKGNYWKGPFHLPRMQLTCWKTLTALAEGGPGSQFPATRPPASDAPGTRR